MSWYPTPIQPMDPVVVSQQPKPPIRYVRDNFMGTGQNSYTQPPAQDQAMWQKLLNIQPITQGTINQRWGFNQFAGVSFTANRLYNFQSDAVGTRAILTAGVGFGGAGVEAFTETGAIYNPTVLIPVAPNGVMRSITSRNYQYFCDGNNALDPVSHRSGDSLKWNGAPAALAGVTNIGILATDAAANTAGGGTTSNTLGPNPASIATDLADFSNPWVNPNGSFGNNPSFAAHADATETATVTSVPFNPNPNLALSNPKLNTDTLQTTGFTFSSIPAAVQGVQVAITYRATYNGAASFMTPAMNIFAQLTKNNVGTGGGHGGTLIVDGALHTLTLGNSTDLWGASFAGADVASSQFGVQFKGYGYFSQNANFMNVGVYNMDIQLSVSYVTITVSLDSTSGTSSTSGAGVGILGGVAGGNVTLTLGRTYYLVPNNSLTGHFGDLSNPSGNTGAATNAEFNLLLATYLDPQVDTKYVLATPDGGDPSILYEAQVLAPGLVISSWAIVANVVTFTGTYPNAQFANGSTFIVGGLSHGSYMNGQTLTVTSHSPTTVVAAFTHGNDSATEVGIAGNNTFAIPNNVTFVVDNTADPDLVLNQPLLFTDQFGNEFGLSLNDPPPAGSLMIKHQGRLWMAGVPGATHSIFFSKSVNELTLPDGFIAGKYEESWPGSNYFDVSDGAESVSGLLSDGTTLYIGTESHIRRLLGNSPANFQEPQIVHPLVGLINQEVWQTVYLQGVPSGCMWMTPDFKVMQSDFNSYVDVGSPIQDILNALQPSAQTLAHAMYVADGEFDLYILAVPYLQSTYCDTHLVFDLRHRQWYVWQPAGGSVSMLFNISQVGAPQWFFINSGLHAILQYSSAATTDNGAGIPVEATTTWLHLGEPTRRKLLNEVQVYGNTEMLMTVKGANNLGAFTNPATIVYNRALKRSPFGTWNLYLTGARTHHRYYQFSFFSSGGVVPLLGSYSIASTPLDDL